MKGLVSFVGAGPGAPDLLTLRGLDRLRRADVAIWASSLVSEDLLAHLPPGTPCYDSASMTLEDVLRVYAEHPDERVVRLHSGDPSLYGAIQEQIDWCETQRRPYEIVPGVSSLGAAAAALGHELTVPGVSQSVVCTRVPGRTAASMPAAESLAAFAATGCTLAAFLSGARPQELLRGLLAEGSAYDATTPAAVVVRASWPDEQVRRTTLGELGDTLAATGATRTLLVLVGEALAASSASGGRRSNLYSPAFAHAFRRRSAPGTTAGRPAGRRVPPGRRAAPPPP